MTSPKKFITYTKHILGFIDGNTKYTNDWKNNIIDKIRSRFNTRLSPGKHQKKC